MSSAVPLRTDFSASELLRLAKQSKDNNQSRRLLSLAAVMEYRRPKGGPSDDEALTCP